MSSAKSIQPLKNEINLNNLLMVGNSKGNDGNFIRRGKVTLYTQTLVFCSSY